METTKPITGQAAQRFNRRAATFWLPCSLFTLTQSALAITAPELPRIYVHTKFELPTAGTTWRVSAGDSLQAALNAAQPGDIVELQSGAVFRGNFVLPQKNGAGWIYVISSKYAENPAEGIRISPKDAAKMARIETPNSAPAIRSNFGAARYRLVGLEIASTFSGTVYNLVHLGYQDRYPTTDSEFASQITIDRCYLHGEENQSIFRAINGCGKDIALVDSYISNIHVVGYDSQAFSAIMGAGPYKITNNYLEAAGENFMTGGGGSPVPKQFIPSDIEFRGNYLFKPLRWKVGHPEYAGTAWTVKNLFELKVGRRVLVEGNILENSWIHGQNGNGFVITPREALIEDVTIRNNIIRSCFIGLGMNPADVTLARVKLDNNLWYDIDYFVFLLSSPSGPKRSYDVTISHNTALLNESGSSFLVLADDPVVVENLLIQNNLSSNGRYGIGALSWFERMSLNYHVQRNLLIAGIQPAHENQHYREFFTPSNLAEVGFLNIHPSQVADFRLAADSAFKNLATTGNDIGVDMDQLLANTRCTLEGSCRIEQVAPRAPTGLRLPSP